ncbi:MAG: hypothetical protein L6R35_005217, partial [Caloplaca aegaea]
MPPHTPPRGAMAAPDTPQLTDEGSSDELQVEEVEGVIDMDEGEEGIIGEEDGEEEEDEEDEEEDEEEEPDY